MKRDFFIQKSRGLKGGPNPGEPPVKSFPVTNAEEVPQEDFDALFDQYIAQKAAYDAEMQRVQGLTPTLLNNAQKKDEGNIPTRTNLGWIDQGKFFCNSHTCELLGDSGYTVPGNEPVQIDSRRTLNPGDKFPLIPGNMQMKGNLGKMGFVPVSQEEWQPGDVVQEELFKNSDYQGNYFSDRWVPSHSTIYAGNENGEKVYYNAPGGARDNFAKTPVSGHGEEGKDWRMQGYRYVGNIPALEEQMNATKARLAKAPVKKMPIRPITQISTSIPEIQRQSQEQIYNQRLSDIESSELSKRKKKKAIQDLDTDFEIANQYANRVSQNNNTAQLRYGGHPAPDKKELLKNFKQKQVDPGFVEAELTDEEIEQYRKGGWIIEELPVAQEGGSTPKFKKGGGNKKPSKRELADKARDQWAWINSHYAFHADGTPVTYEEKLKNYTDAVEAQLRPKNKKINTIEANNNRNLLKNLKERRLYKDFIKNTMEGIGAGVLGEDEFLQNQQRYQLATEGGYKKIYNPKYIQNEQGELIEDPNQSPWDIEYNTVDVSKNPKVLDKWKQRRNKAKMMNHVLAEIRGYGGLPDAYNDEDWNNFVTTYENALADKKNELKYQRAKKLNKAGKYKGDYASDYKESGWDKYDPNVVREDFKGQWAMQSDLQNEEKRKTFENQLVTGSELSGIAAGNRIAADPKATLTDIAYTGADIITAPVNIITDTNPLTGEKYWNHTQGLTDVLSVLPFAQGFTKTANLGKGLNMVKSSAPVRYIDDVIGTTKMKGKFSLPKYQNTYRIEDPGVNMTATSDDITGRWFLKTPNTDETAFYLQNLKDPSGNIIKNSSSGVFGFGSLEKPSKVRIMTQRLPEYKINQQFGAAMPEEARMMSLGRGNMTNSQLDEVVGAGAGNRFTQGRFLDSDYNAMETAPFLFNSNEGILSASQVNQLRRGNAGILSGGKSQIFDDQAEAFKYFVNESEAAKNVSKFKQRLPFEEGGSTYAELTDEEIKAYREGGWIIEEM